MVVFRVRLPVQTDGGKSAPIEGGVGLVILPRAGCRRRWEGEEERKNERKEVKRCAGLAVDKGGMAVGSGVSEKVMDGPGWRLGVWGYGDMAVLRSSMYKVPGEALEIMDTVLYFEIGRAHV